MTVLKTVVISIKIVCDISKTAISLTKNNKHKKTVRLKIIKSD